MFDITALGELLIDFTPYNAPEAKSEVFEKNPGGAPANVLVAASQLGCSTSFLGMVGQDQFGRFLIDILDENGVCTKGMRTTHAANTTLAFVHLNSEGDRTFSFYRNPGADTMLSIQDVDFEMIKKSRLFHFGSLSMTHEPCRSATIAALEHAKENNIIVSYDPNLRPSLWKSLEDAKNAMHQGLKYADIIKVSEEELQFITGTADFLEGTEILHQAGVRVIFVTLGSKGCFYRYKGGYGLVDGYHVAAIDTTGAGDAFLGAALYKIISIGWDKIDTLPTQDFEAVIQFANAAGALATTKKGAIPAMPKLDEVLELCGKSKKVEKL